MHTLNEMVALVSQYYNQFINLEDRSYSAHLKDSSCAQDTYRTIDPICDCPDNGSVTLPKNRNNDWVAMLQEVATELYYLDSDTQAIIKGGLYGDEYDLLKHIGL